MTETDDERAIRALIEEWFAATKRGDGRAVLELMTDDAIFLVPGQPPMGKAAFVLAAEAPPEDRPAFDGVVDIEEIGVDGNLAYVWAHLTVTVTPPRRTEPIKRTGYTLTVFRKVDGRWLLARDANLLGPA
jgi:uncharacterized protein (TIGR02246 family)